MNEEQLERLGQLIDQADNFLEFADGGRMAAGFNSLRIEALGTGLKQIRAGILAIYLEAGGTDEWSGRDAI